jgi:hypothetical protein
LDYGLLTLDIGLWKFDLGPRTSDIVILDFTLWTFEL